MTAGLLVGGCSDHSTSPTEALSITRVSGNEQTGTPGAYLANSLVVLVTDRVGQPAANQRVDFEVVEGTATLSVESTLSDASGQASTRLHLGAQSGLVQVRASAFGSQEVVYFRATVAPLQDTTAAPPTQPITSDLPFAGDVLRTRGSGHVEIADAPSLYLNQQFTIELWFRVERLNSGNVFGWNQLLANNEYEIAIVAGTSRITTCCYDGRSLTSLLDGNSTIELGRWYHLALVNDGTTQRILLNGQLDSIVGTVKQHPDRQMALWFGNDPDADRPLDGYIDEVRLWTRPLGIEEIQTYMNRPRAGTEDGLVGYWTFDALTPEGRVPDLSGHGNDGRLAGDAEVVPGP